MEVKLAVLADAANVSKEGKLNIFGIFNQMKSKTFPITWPALAVVIRFEAHASEAGDHEVTIRLADADGRELARLDGSMKLQRGPTGQPLLGQIILGLAGLQLKEPGTYSFDILIDGRYEGSIPLFVRKMG